MNKKTVYCVYERPHHSPMALGMVVSYAKAYRNGLLNESYEFDPTFYFTTTSLLQAIQRSGPGIVLFSHYLWNSEGFLAVSEGVKRLVPECITVHGGPSVPKYDYACAAFMAKHPHVDIAVRGEGEVTLADLLDQLASVPRGTDWRPAIADVRGITFCPDPKDRTQVLRTEERERLLDLDTIPSPYLNGYFDTAQNQDWIAAILETNRGCPYSCTFCDWGSATMQKVRQFDLARVQAEIEWTARRRMEVLWLADANFGILARDVEVAEMIAAAKARYGYPRQVVANYAKNATPRLTEIVRIFSRAGLAAEGIIALQTTDPHTLDTIRRSNIKTERYEDLLAIFQQEHMTVSTDLLIGLPGATVESFQSDLQFCFDRRVHAKAYTCMVLPNSQMGHRDYMQEHGIVVDDWNFVISTKTASADDIQKMQQFYEVYLVATEFSVFAYLLRFLQKEHQIQAVAFLAQLMDDVASERPGLAQVRHVLNVLGRNESCKSGRVLYRSSAAFLPWKKVYDEIADYLRDRWGIARDSALDTLLRVQRHLMPRWGTWHPKTLNLAHDVVAYFQDFDRPGLRLRDLPPARLKISDPHNLCWIPYALLISYGHHKVHFELQSPLMSDQTQPRFLFSPQNFNPIETFSRLLPIAYKMYANAKKNYTDYRANRAFARQQAVPEANGSSAAAP